MGTRTEYAVGRLTENGTVTFWRPADTLGDAEAQMKWWHEHSPDHYIVMTRRVSVIESPWVAAPY